MVQIEIISQLIINSQAQLTKSKKKKSKMHHDKRMALKIAPKENKPDNAN